MKSAISFLALSLSFVLVTSAANSITGPDGKIYSFSEWTAATSIIVDSSTSSNLLIMQSCEVICTDTRLGPFPERFAMDVLVTESGADTPRVVEQMLTKIEERVSANNLMESHRLSIPELFRAAPELASDPDLRVIQVIPTDSSLLVRLKTNNPKEQLEIRLRPDLSVASAQKVITSVAQAK